MVRRVLIPVAIAAATLVLVYRIGRDELRCNRVWAVVSQGNTDALDLPDYDALLLVRNNIPKAIPCIERRCPNVFLMYELASTYRRVGRHDDAIALLERSMRYDRRPEIFIALGDSLAQRGRLEEGLGMLLTGARFYGRDEGYIKYMMRNTAYRDIILERMRVAGEL
jgi:hypothetical protein